MMAFNVYLSRYDWLVRVYVRVTHIDADSVLDSLRSIGCAGTDLRRCSSMLRRPSLNSGICYSNKQERISVMVITRTSSPEEFYNSSVHEIAHLATHIAQRDGISLQGEEICYLQGDFAAKIYPKVKNLLCCECCNNKIN